MSNLIFKQPNQEDPSIFYYIEENSFCIHPRLSWVEYCEEYDIIKKIRENSEGYFDFSKNLIDIGAEDGNYSMLCDFKHNYCFEPNKKSICLLYTNMYLKNKTACTDVYNIGLDAAPGSIMFNGFVCDGSQSIMENHPVDGILFEDKYEIKTKTLDSFDIENVGLIKIDVEGFEERVIRGGLLTIIKNNYPPILFECWDVGKLGMTQEKHDNLFNLLKSMGYDIVEYWGDHETHLAIHD